MVFVLDQRRVVFSSIVSGIKTSTECNKRTKTLFICIKQTSYITRKWQARDNLSGFMFGENGLMESNLRTSMVLFTRSYDFITSLDFQHFLGLWLVSSNLVISCREDTIANINGWLRTHFLYEVSWWKKSFSQGRTQSNYLLLYSNWCLIQK